jgi:F420-dependent oxidoreductase-like protein
MQIGLHVTRFNWPEGDAAIRPRVAAIARRADEAGFAGFWPMDHFFQIPVGGRPAEEPMLEGYTLLSFAAGVTERISLGTLVTGVTYRHPGILVKTVTTLDVLSGGRAWLGAGAGYQQDEARDLGLPLPPPRERFEHLEDTIRLAAQMWQGDTTPFHGRHARLERPTSSPRPVTTPHPPILIGGTGERRTLRLVAQYADACNVFDIPDNGVTIRHKLAVLRQHCTTIGRDDADITKTVSTALADGEPAARFAERCAQLKSYGIDHIVAITRGRPLTVPDLELLATATGV